MNQKERAIRRRLKADFAHYAEKCLKIRGKDGKIAPLKLNAAQKYIHARLEEQLQKTGRVRALILKGRQQGCSTYVEARFYWKVTHKKGARAFILTHLEEASRGLYQIVRRFHDHCPAPLRPHTGFSNSRELVFDRLDSGYQVGTAKSPGVGRSSTLQYLHGSEVAYWAHAQEHASGILQAVPDARDTEIILESTSAGAEGFFYELCRAAMQGNSEYIFLFVPWFWQDEYRKNPSEDFLLTPEEADCKNAFGLDDAQVFWRRSKVAELGGLWTFRREYPATPEEAFHADRPGALWTRSLLQKNRKPAENLPEMKRIVVAVDPAVTANKTSDETGIVVAGLGIDGHGYVLADLSGKYSPAEWAGAAIAAYHRFEADRVIAEVNQGGDMVEHTLRAVDPAIPYRAVRASRGKTARAEPVAALDAQGLIHHAGIFAALEDQLCRFDASVEAGNCDRADARTWAFTELMLSRHPNPAPRIWGGGFI